MTITEDESNVDVKRAIDNLNKYYKCNGQVYTYQGKKIKLSMDEIKELIKTQIDEKYPLAFYYKPSSGDGSCVIIDGYSEDNSKFVVHLNSGRDGWNNQWHEIEPLLYMKYVLIITIN